MSSASKHILDAIALFGKYLGTLLTIRCLAYWLCIFCYHNLKTFAIAHITKNQPRNMIGANMIPCIRFLRASFSFSFILRRSVSYIAVFHILISLSYCNWSTTATGNTGSCNGNVLSASLIEYNTGRATSIGHVYCGTISNVAFLYSI